MSLSVDLISQFVEATKDEPKKTSDGIAYGEVKIDGNNTLVRLDGSTTWTPASTTVYVKDGERVSVLIKNHTATITGSFGSEAANPDPTTPQFNGYVTELNSVIAQKVTSNELIAQSAFIKFLYSEDITAEVLKAAMAEIDKLQADKITVDNLEAIYGDIENLRADLAKLGVATIDKATIKELNAQAAYFRNVEADYGEFIVLSAKNAEVGDLVAKNIEAKIIKGDALDAKFAEIDFANIKEAALEKIYSNIGVIEGFTTKDATVTGKLVAVLIKGDLIEAGTLRADRLIVKGTDGEYYAINTDFTGKIGVEPVKEDMIHGSVMVAKSVTADKISVTDLEAFKALIAGFSLAPNEYELDENGDYVLDEDGNPKLIKVGAIHSGVKSSVDNTTRGIYLDNEGQVNFGDTHNFVKFYKNPETGKYELAINASRIILGNSGTDVEEAVSDAIESITKQYAVTASMDTPPSNESAGGYDITAIQNDDGTQTLSIVDAADGGDYNIASVQNEDGTQALAISDAWSETPPTWSPGMYLWTRDKIVYKNPSRTEYTDPVCDTSWGAVNEVDESVSTAQSSANNAASVAREAHNLATTLDGTVEDNKRGIEGLNGAIIQIRDELANIVINDKGDKASLWQQTADGTKLTFADVLKSNVDGLVHKDDLEYRGHMEFKDGDGDPFIKIFASKGKDANIALKLTNNEIQFVDMSDIPVASIVADMDGRPGMAIDNETVTGEFRQSNPAATDPDIASGEFVWQVRANGNYGLSWKTSRKG